MPRARWWELLAAACTAWLVHGATATNFLYTHDGWNDVILGELVLSGGLPWHTNLLRLLPTLSFGPRAAFGVSTFAWHLPNLLVHGLCAALIVALTRRLGGNRPASVCAGLLFAAMPLLTHPVEWVGGGYDLFATAGVLGCAVAFVDRRTGWAIACLLVALLSKESGATCVALVALIAVAKEGWPRQWRTFALRLAPLVGVTALALALRWLQVRYSPVDAMAGRSVQADPLGLLLSAPGAVGLGVAGPVLSLFELRDPAAAMPLGLAGLIVVGALCAWRRLLPAAWLALAGMVALVPVSLIAMSLGEMVDNARYLYLTCAVVAPILPLALKLDSMPWRGLAALLVGLAIWGSADRVWHSLPQTRAAQSTAEHVLTLKPQSQVWVLTNLYDEATARFLMSRWLARRRGVRAHYVLRGSWTTYSRSGGPAEDAALSYFAPQPTPFAPSDVNPGDAVLMQRPGKAETTILTALPVRAAGAWVAVDPVWTPTAPEDPEDDPMHIEGRTLQVRSYLGPVASSQHVPAATTPIPPGPITAVELTLRVRSNARVRYGTGYHERFGMLFFGDDFVSFEIPRVRGEITVVQLDLRYDSAANGTYDSLGLLPLNYPGDVTVEALRIRR